MKIGQIAGVVVSTTALFAWGTVPPASAINNIKDFGVQETLKNYYSLSDFNSEIGYTVKYLKPSTDPVPYPVAGRLYEADVTADAIVGTVTPQVDNFRARTPAGVDYRVLSNVSTLSGASLGPGGIASGKLYFDVVGENPDSIVFNNGSEDLLGWVNPKPLEPGEVTPGSDTSAAPSDGGSKGNDASGVQGSTGPNQAVPPDISNGDQNGQTGPEGNFPSGGNAGSPAGPGGRR